MTALPALPAATPALNAVAGLLANDGPGHWDRPGWWPVFPLLWFLLLAGLALTFVLGRRRREERSARNAGERVLAERYAAGDLDDAEYARRLAVLRRPTGVPPAR